jgi:hypothetical protein
MLVILEAWKASEQFTRAVVDLYLRAYQTIHSVSQLGRLNMEEGGGYCGLDMVCSCATNLTSVVVEPLRDRAK